MMLVGCRGIAAKLTATSRTSFWPPFSVVTALRMAGSCSPSNLTVKKHQYECSEGDYDMRSATMARRQWRLCFGVVGKRFSHTVDDGTNDLVDSAIGVRGSAGEALAKGGSE